MASVAGQVAAGVRALRERSRLVDRVLVTLEHYSDVDGNARAGAVTYYGFLSFFPVMALAFFTVGLLASTYPDLDEDLLTALNHIFPGFVGDGENQISLSTFEDQAATVGLIGLAVLLYSGLGWLSAMRAALAVMFVMPKREQPGFVVGKAIDLLVLVVIGSTLMLSVAISGVVAGLTSEVLGLVGLESHRLSAVLLQVLARLLAITTTTVLFLSMFRLLARPHIPRRSLLAGALLGAVGFEILKALSILLISHTQGKPAFQVFGTALILLLWINYFSRIVMYAAAWSYTHPATVRARAGESQSYPALAPGHPDRAKTGQPGGAGSRAAGAAVAGAAAGAVLVGARALRRRRQGASGRMGA